MSTVRNLAVFLVVGVAVTDLLRIGPDAFRPMHYINHGRGARPRMHPLMMGPQHALISWKNMVRSDRENRTTSTAPPYEDGRTPSTPADDDSTKCANNAKCMLHTWKE